MMTTKLLARLLVDGADLRISRHGGAVSITWSRGNRRLGRWFSAKELELAFDEGEVALSGRLTEMLEDLTEAGEIG